MTDDTDNVLRDRDKRSGQYTASLELDEILGVMEIGEPYGTTEVRKRLEDEFDREMVHRTVYSWLQKLADRGDVRRKKIDAKRNVWIRLPDAVEPADTNDDADEEDGFSTFTPQGKSTHIVKDDDPLCGQFELPDDATPQARSNDAIASELQSGDSCGNCERLWRLKTDRADGDGWDG